MSLPYVNITQIPNNEPDAIPALWNTRYSEIDANFLNIDGRVVGHENELAAARGASTVAARLASLDASVAVTGVDTTNMDIAALKYALAQAALANQGISALRSQVQQEGEITITNRGLITGAAITKLGTSRLLAITAGKCFINGRTYSLAAQNSTSVPVTTGASSVCYGYLFLNASSVIQFYVTALGVSVPSDGIKVCTITIPAGNTDAALAGVTVSSDARTEPNYPTHLDSPFDTLVTINPLTDDKYRIDIDVVSSTGAPCRTDAVVAYSRAANGFRLSLASAADNVVVRWRISALALPAAQPLSGGWMTRLHAAAPATYPLV